MTNFFNWFKQVFTKHFWIQEFPKEWPPECFDCKLTQIGRCKECKYNKIKI